MTTTSASIEFFVSYAESQGALAELVPEGAVLALPDELSQALELPDDLAVTEDPEVSREDGYILLVPGHPLLLSAAQSVFERGDVGWSRLPWPQGLPPSPKDLEQKAREQIHPEHGRVDITESPEAMHLLILRVGALLTHRISVDEQVHELEETWVVATTGAPVPGQLEVRLRSAAAEPGAPAGIRTEIVPGVSAADARLRSRAERRSEDLARQTTTRLHAQLTVVDDYYRRVIASIEERRARATSDRVPLLDAQAEATQAEWSRRRAEVNDELNPTFDVKPIRLHVLGVPAFTVIAVVRRGARTYPLPLVYIPLTASFLPPVCPSCGATDGLIAGKSGLGCRSCVGEAKDGIAATALTGTETIDQVGNGAKRPSTPSPPVPGDAHADKGPPVSMGSPKSSPSPRPSTSERKQPVDRQRDRNAAGGSRSRHSGRVTPKGSRSGETLSRTGGRLAVAFWESVASSRRVSSHDVVPGSPLEALLWLYGVRGPSLLVGLENHERPMAISSVTQPHEKSDSVSVTAGELSTSAGREVPFAIFWRSRPSTAIFEIESFPVSRVGHLLVGGDDFGYRIRERFESFLLPPPKPIVDLDSAASLLLHNSATMLGLSFGARCMAAWRYLTEWGTDGAATARRLDPLAPSAASAAALEVVVAKRMELRITTNSAAEHFGCDVEDVRREVRHIAAMVREREDVGW